MTTASFDTITDALVQRMPSHAKFLTHTLSLLTNEERVEADAYCRYLLKNHNLDFVLTAYQTIVDDTMMAQIEFFRTKNYRYSTFAEVAGSVYFDASYMNRYMVGLALSTFLWPNHVELFRFFCETLPRDAGGTYLEIGPGHGFFFLQAMRHSGFEKFVGVDLSSSSIALTKDVITNLAPDQASRCAFMEMDFLTADKLVPPYSGIVMGEVLEHVEQPQKFLRRIAALASKDTYIFITTCVNAPAVDHIYLFRTVEDVETMIGACGLRIKSSKIVPYPGKSLTQCVSGDLPINVAYVLER